MAVLLRRLRWYRDRFKGTLVAIRGNTVRMDGMTYSVAPFSSTLKCTLAKGRHEEPERDLVRHWLPPDVPVIELGGGMGAVSCLANRKLSDPARHVVLEANPSMIPLLTFNRDLNGCKFTVVNRALGYESETITLDIDPDFVGSSAFGISNATATTSVPTTTVSDLAVAHDFEHCGIICDIEGLEAELIEREFAQLGPRIRYILAEMHPFIIGRGRTNQLLKSLREMGFVEKQQIADCIFYSRS